MSAPPSGPSGSSGSASSPAPGYYPDPSIPNYIRYWNGSAWVPGTSRPAPPGESGTASGPPAPGPVVPPPAMPAVDESGPMFLDADPAAPTAVQGTPAPTVPPQPAAGEWPEPAAAPPAAEWPEPAEPAGGWPSPAGQQAAAAPGPAWPVPAANPPGGELPPISWGAQGQPAPHQHPAPHQQQQPAPQPFPMPSPPEPPTQSTPSPIGNPPVPQQNAAPWAEQVHELARDAPLPWRPVAADPFASARAQDRPGGLLRRLAAWVVDTVVFVAVTGAAALPLGSAAYHHAQDKVDAAKLTGETVKVWLLDATTGAEAAAALLVALLAGILLEVLPTAKWGRTLGKKLTGLRVLDIEAQQPPTFWPSLRRWLLRTVLNALAIGAVGMAWALIDRPWHQAWHDKATHTFVAAS
ncbi:RDD family protein [Actinacidiphila epipremni]|uniref:RDD family protein n=1 Tax=Actinacidiphila epipremni TaxID=2053013 RepID=A0ABX0ZDQ1_9ACTN|nr:RDD family protein [Actinacidiphila epipremni]NJP41884.1 RDD family protein [Actinacidiphila epipremni]